MKMTTDCLTAVVASTADFLWLLPLRLLKCKRKEENGRCWQNPGYGNGYVWLWCRQWNNNGSV